MNVKSLLTILPLAILAGCQSTSTPPSELATNLCTTGDASSSTLTSDVFEKAVRDCGGYEVFTDDMLLNQTLAFTFGKKNKSREMKLMDDGTGSYMKMEKGTTETVKWKFKDNGDLLLAFDDGYQWSWKLLKQEGAEMAVKSFGYSADGQYRDILSMIVTNKDAALTSTTTEEAKTEEPQTTTE